MNLPFKMWCRNYHFNRNLHMFLFFAKKSIGLNLFIHIKNYTAEKAWREHCVCPRLFLKNGGRSMSVKDSVTKLSGVGAKRAENLATLGIERVEDLLGHYPFRYEDIQERKNRRNSRSRKGDD